VNLRSSAFDRFLSRSLGVRLTLVLTLVVAVVVVVLVYETVESERVVLDDQLNAHGSTLALAAVNACRDWLLMEDYPVIDTLARDLVKEDEGISYVIVHRSDGTVVSRYPEDATENDQDENRRIFSRPIPVGDVSVGRVVIGLSTERSRQFMNSRARSLAIGATIGFGVLALIVGLVIRQVVSRPLKHLAAQAIALGAGDLQTPIRLASNDELSDLSRALDKMRDDLRASYDTLHSQNAELSRLDAMKDEFLVSVTNELRTPLNGILGLSQAIRIHSGNGLSDEARDHLERIDSSAEGLLRLADQLLKLTFETPEPPTGVAEIDVREFYDLLLKKNEYLIAQSRVRTTTTIEGTLSLRIDGNLLESIMDNLLSNAIRYGAAGEVRLLGRRLRGGVIALSVLDTGQGIPKSQQENIFEPFRRVEQFAARESDGARIGLSIVRRGVESCGGAVCVESQLGLGSLFTVLLPGTCKESSEPLGPDGMVALWQTERRTLPSAWQLPTVKHPSEEGVGTAFKASSVASISKDREDVIGGSEVNIEVSDLPVVMVADDNAINRDIVKAFLKDRYRIVEAENGERCLELLKVERVDLVLLSIVMPGVSGYDVLEQLPELGLADPPQIIVLTSLTQRASLSKALVLGAVDAICKPFNQDELLARINVHVQNRQQRMRADQLRLEAETENRTKSEFLSNMSHEIRTPMTAILGFAEVVLGNVQDPLNIEGLRTIQRNGQHLMGIINDILDLSKIEAGKLAVEYLDFSPLELIDEVVASSRVPADAKGLPLLVDYDGPVPASIRSDPTRLRQILINLVGNAVKFTDVGRVRVVVRLLDAESAGPQLHIDVVDSGLGMSNEQLGRLFQPFAQADSSTTRQFGGTGLGLTISKCLAETLGGSIQALSEPQRGSTFTLTLPTGSLDGVELVSKPSEQRLVSQPTEEPVGDGLTGEPAVTASGDVDPAVVGGTVRNSRILLAEDGNDAERLVSIMLKKAGAYVMCADNGKTAVNMAITAQNAEVPFDVILMDMQMPLLDGYEATRRLREADYKGPIVALTAHAMIGDREKCLKAGCNDYLAKPVLKDQLLSVVSQYASGAADV